MLGLQGLTLFAFPPVLLLLLSYAIFLRRKQSSVSYPPGPTPIPVIGNLFDIPFSNKPWLKYLDWSKRLNSEIIHMSASCVHLVVLHTMEDAKELLEKRSATYSDRKMIPIFELLGLESLSAMLPYGDRWRTHRRIFQEILKKDKVHSFHHIMTNKVYVLLGELLHNPENFREHCKWLAASFSLTVTFAYDIAPENLRSNPIVEAIDSVDKLLIELAIPGRTLINVFPILARIPPWIPGAYTQRLAATAKQSAMRYRTELFDYVRKNMAANKHEDCMLVKLFQCREENPSYAYDDATLKDVTTTMYTAGVETIQSAQMTFILSLALHQAQQRKAQAEIDRVVGTHRLPTFDDRPSLPYVEALHREVQRWRPVVPLGFPHSTTKDDTYKGFYIPKGALVMPNVWAITRDASRYHDPESFMPERLFNTDGTLNDDTIDYGFGFGRRICPGRHLADSMVWLVLVSVLSAFSISKAKDQNGIEIDISPDAFVDAVVTHPLPFKCSIKPRFAQTEALISSMANGVRKAQ